jgi:hypothetical protein
MYILADRFYNTLQNGDNSSLNTLTTLTIKSFFYPTIVLISSSNFKMISESYLIDFLSSLQNAFLGGVL